MKALVIIPAYNEEANIVAAVQRVVEAGYDYIVVNDGSKDATAEICKQNGFNVLDLPENLGIGGAIQAGHRYALRYGYDVDVQFDGDGQHDVTYIPTLLAAIEEGADLVVGSRFLEETEGFKSTVMRRIGIKWLEVWIKLFSGCRVTDSTSGFRACSRKAIKLFCDYYPSDYPEPESIAYAHMNGLMVKEVPVVMHERLGGVSSIGKLSSVYYMLKVSMAISILKIGRRKR